jgi:hypothetical protein
VVTQNPTRVVNVRSIALVFAALVLLMAGILAVNWYSATSTSGSGTPTQAAPSHSSSGQPNLGPARPQRYF